METNLAKVYTIDWFINKFEAIPEEGVINAYLDDDKGNHCAEGWADKWGRPVRTALDNLFSKYLQTVPSMVNNEGQHPRYQQPTPKQRILAALYDIKKLQTKDIDTGGKVKTVYVAVPVSITDPAKELVLS